MSAAHGTGRTSLRLDPDDYATPKAQRAAKAYNDELAARGTKLLNSQLQILSDNVSRALADALNVRTIAPEAAKAVREGRWTLEEGLQALAKLDAIRESAADTIARAKEGAAAILATDPLDAYEESITRFPALARTVPPVPGEVSEEQHQRWQQAETHRLLQERAAGRI